MFLRPACPLLLVVALCLARTQGPPAAQAQGPERGKEPPVEIRVESILATYPPEHPLGRLPVTRMDKRLDHDGVGRRLQSMFDFTDYRVIKHTEASTICGQPVAFNLPAGHILHVQPFEVEGEELAIDVMMFEGERMIMRMPFRTVAGGMLFLVDQHHPNQIYITAITIDSQMLARRRHDPGDHYAIDAPMQFSPALVPNQ